MKNTCLMLMLCLMMPLNSFAYRPSSDQFPVVYATYYEQNEFVDRVPQAYLIQHREPRDLDEQLDNVQERIISLCCALCPAITCAAIIVIISKYLSE